MQPPQKLTSKFSPNMRPPPPKWSKFLLNDGCCPPNTKFHPSAQNSPYAVCSQQCTSHYLTLFNPSRVSCYYQPLFTRRTSGLCLGTSRAANFSVSPSRCDKCSASQCTPPSFATLLQSTNIVTHFSIRCMSHIRDRRPPPQKKIFVHTKVRNVSNKYN